MPASIWYFCEITINLNRKLDLYHRAPKPHIALTPTFKDNPEINRRVRRNRMDQENIITWPDEAEELYSIPEVQDTIAQIAQDLTVLSESNPLVLPMMNGGLFFTGQLLPQLNFPLQCDYIHVTRYHETTSGSDLHWKKTPSQSLAGRTVLLLDDILDEGVTLESVTAYCEEQGAKKVVSAVLTRKERNGKPIASFKPDWWGLPLPDCYCFG